MRAIESAIGAPREEESPFEVLAELARGHATGEVLVVDDALEVHVYLAAGRVAWATTSESRFAFARFVLERTGLDKATFRELLEECRVRRRPLGETLVEWRLASPEDVREGLHLQIADALRSLGTSTRPRTVFLPRGSSGAVYDPRFTFALDDLVRGSGPRCAPSVDLDRLAASLPPARWTYVVRAGVAPLGSATPAIEPELPRWFAATGADFLAVRSPLGIVVALVGPERGTTTWFGFDAEESLAPLLADMRTGDGDAPSPVDSATVVPVGTPCVRCGPIAYELLVRSLPATALSFRDAAGRAWGFERAGSARAPDGCVAAGASLLSSSAIGRALPERGDDPLRGLGLDRRTLVAAVGDLFLFASLADDGSGRTTWVSLPRRSRPALGWALLGALGRVLGSACTSCR